MAGASKVADYHRRVTEHLPELTNLGRLRRARAVLPPMGVMAVLDVNDWILERWGGELPARWDPLVLPWARDVRAAWPAMQAEMSAYLQSRTIPETAEIIGLDPASAEARASVPTDTGAWRSLILRWFGTDIAANTRHFPETMKVLDRVTGINSMGFTALDGRSHIAEHRGPNRGAVRYQLPIIVPGEPGACRIRIGDEMVSWSEGEPVVFDLSVLHEVWNDTDEVRVLLMMEVPMPLPFPLSLSNRLAQHLYRYFPTFDALPGRVTELASDPLHEVSA